MAIAPAELPQIVAPDQELPDNPKPSAYKPKSGGQLRELPTYTDFDIKTVVVVRRLLREFMGGGSFRGAADLLDHMLADARIRASFQTRAAGLFGLPMRYELGLDGRRNARVQRLLEEYWPRMVPAEQGSQLLLNGLGLNLGIGQLHWHKEEDLWWPELQTWHSRNAQWMWSSEGYALSTLNGLTQLTPGDGQWVVYTPYGFRRGWVYALVRALAIPWMARTFTIQDWSRHVELFGQGVRKAIVPADADQVNMERHFKAVAALGRESTILLQNSEDKDGNPVPGFDVKFEYAQQESYRTFAFNIEQHDSDIAIAILGQNLTTEVKEGSRAAADVHQGVREDLRRWDNQTFSACLYEQMVRLWAQVNFGDPDVAPKPCWEVEPPEDLAGKSKTFHDLALALGGKDAGLTTVSAGVDVRAVLEEFGVQMLTPAEEAAVQAGRDAQAEADAEQAAEQAAAIAGGGPKPGEEGQQQAANSKAALSVSAPGQKLGEWQTFVDEAATRYRDAGADDLEPDVADLLATIQAASDFGQLRTALVERYKAMSPEALAKVLERCVLLARLGGRLAVLEGL